MADSLILDLAIRFAIELICEQTMPLTPPNLVTLFRIATAPVLIWLLMYTGPAVSFAAAGVFFVATISDYFDGYLAPSYNSVSTRDKFLHPLSAKLAAI